MFSINRKIKILFLLFSISYPSLFFGLPTEDGVVHGQVTISKDESSLTVNQTTDKAIINWQDFSIAAKENVNFIQPSSSASVLNRVVGKNISSIYGNLQSNGKVYLINQNGILIGPSGRVNTNGFIASTLNVSDSNFIERKELHFSSDNQTSIQNYGVIDGLDKDVIIISSEIINEGTIKSEKGTSLLVGSSEVYLAEEGSEHISVRNISEGKVDNIGVIEGVEVELRANAGNIYALAINQEGMINAKGIENREGRVILSSETGTINIDGKVLSNNADAFGGTVHVLADNIKLDENTEIDVSGSLGGGTVLIGGDYQGKNPEIKNAKSLFVDENVNINADAILEGNGGKVILWGDEKNQYFGNITAKGGMLSGDGGFVEISSPAGLKYQGKVDTSSIFGKTGTLLLDPSCIRLSGAASDPAFTYPVYNPVGTTTDISYVNITDLENALAVSNVTISTSNGIYTGIGVGGIFIIAPVTWSSSSKLILNADQFVSFSGLGGSYGSLNATGNGSIEIYGPGNDLNNAGGVFLNVLNQITTNTGNITLVGVNKKSGSPSPGILLTLDSSITTNSGSISITGTAAAANGVQLDSDSVINIGSGSLLIDGYGGTNSDTNGVWISQSAISQGASANGGDIEINGTATTGNGIFIDDSTISNSGEGIVILIGNGGTSDRFRGVSIMSSSAGGPSTGIITENGDISITGTGGAGGVGINEGVIVQYSGLSCTGSGDILINGTGGTGGSDCYGISLYRCNVVYSLHGNIDTNSGNITLIGVSQGNDVRERGIFIDGTDIESTSGSIYLNGTGSSLAPSGLGAIGVYMGNYTSFSSLGNSDITFVGTRGTSGDDGIYMSSIDFVTNNTGNIIISTDDTYTLDAIFTTSGDLKLYPKTASNSIGVGSGTGSFLVSNASLTALGASVGSLIIGNSTSGSHVIEAGDITLPKPLSIYGDSISTIGNINANSKNLYFNIGTVNDGFFEISHVISNPATVQLIGNASNTNTFTISTGNNNSWNITGNNAGNAGGIDFTYIHNLEGGSGEDTFTFDGAYDLGSIDGFSGTNNSIKGADVNTDWTIIASNAGTMLPSGVVTPISFLTIQNLEGGNGEDTFTFDGAYDLGSIDGSSGTNNSIKGADVNTDWTITASNTGTILPSGVVTPISFLTIQNLKGGSGVDTFIPAEGFIFNGSIDGTSNINLLDYSLYTSNIIVNLETGSIAGITGSALNIQKIIASQGKNTLTGKTGEDNIFEFKSAPVTDSQVTGGTGSNTLQVLDASNKTWNILDANSGNIDGSGELDFSDINILEGGSGEDTFALADGVTFNGSIDAGSGGINALDYSQYISNIIVNLETGSIVGVTGSALNIQKIVASQGQSNLTGKNGEDNIFEFKSALVTGSQVAGGTGNNTLQVLDASNKTWNISYAKSGNVDDPGELDFSDISSLIGGVGNDTFVFAGAFKLNSIDGGSGGLNEIEGCPVDNTWIIDDVNSGSFTPNGVVTPIQFTRIQSLKGSGDSSFDHFYMHEDSSLEGQIDAGKGTDNLLDYSDFNAAVTIDLSKSPGEATAIDGGIINFHSIGGSGDFIGGDEDDTFYVSAGTSFVDGGGGSNTIFGPEEIKIWHIVDVDAETENCGIIGSDITFTNVQNLVGGSYKDTFSMEGTSLTGTIAGGLGSNFLDYSSYTAPVVVNLEDGTATDIYGGIPGGVTDIQNIIAGTDENTLTGKTGIDNKFTFTVQPSSSEVQGGTESINTVEMQSGDNLFNITGNHSGNVSVNITFNNIQNLQAGSGQDSFFLFSSGQMEKIIGNGANDILYGKVGINNNWNIMSYNTGSVEGVTLFENVENITGGDSSDNFNLYYDEAGITGTVDGGLGDNILSYWYFNKPVFVDLVAGTATNIGSVVNITNYIIHQGAPISRAQSTFTNLSISLPPNYSFVDPLNYLQDNYKLFYLMLDRVLALDDVIEE